ncbi:C2 domain-containing protein [Lactarius akahatsu]|uniref:C2 domain-containing protein n=1 Tax=Lactarius akahatsu TaxID=416441 RepID=A0AAD4LNN8_9AGAM|nr:C2 domain-containing protein [Lactarius akahatsu]
MQMMKKISTFGRRSSYSSPPERDETPVVLLCVQVLSCRDLLAKDNNGYSDPFVTVSLLGKQFRTPVSKKNLNPKYEDAIFHFPIYSSFGPKLDTLEFVVWDKDMVRKEYLGEYSLPVNQWFKGTAFAFDNKLQSSFGRLYSSRPMTECVRGTVEFKVGFVHPTDPTRQLDFGNTYKTLIANNDNLRTGIVMVDIVDVKDLPQWRIVPHMGFEVFDMDPYVEVSIGQDVRCTSVLQHKLQPVWNEQLLFHVRQESQNPSPKIRLAVFDRDKVTSDDFVGRVEITIASLTDGADFNTSHPANSRTTGMREFDLTLTTTNPKRSYTSIPTIKFRANYRPYVPVALAN